MLPILNHSLADAVIVICLLVFSCVVHESAHAWAASLCGDSTARRLGRITLNPMAHISPFDSVLLPAIIYFATQGSLIFGGAKPVPIMVGNLRNPDRDMALTAGAGPAANLAIASVASLAIWIHAALGAPAMILALLLDLVILNLILCCFNLIPIAPLDGSRIVRYLVPPLRDFYDATESYGIVFLIVAIYTIPGFLGFIWRGTALFLNLAGLDGLYSEIFWMHRGH